jgi:hypothetical protein
VGDFSVDLFAVEEGSGRKIIIENQLTDTNHDHLGKIITYAAGKGADVVVWIVERARDEHRQAIEWLNQRTDENVGFFLVEIELWKIGNSQPAPRFNVVEKPNNWAKEMKAAEGTSETQRLRLDFWQTFNGYAFAKPKFASSFKPRKAKTQHWYSLSVGTSDYYLNLLFLTQKNKLGVEIYFPNNKELYAKFLDQKEDIARFVSCQLEWKEGDKACTIRTMRDADIKKDSSTWNTLFDWYCETAMLIKQMVKKFDA